MHKRWLQVGQTTTKYIATETLHMKQKELSELTDQELLDEAKKRKSTSIMNAVLIGFMIGVVVYSIVKNSWGFLTLIPLFLAYKLFNSSKNNEALEKLLKERNLK